MNKIALGAAALAATFFATSAQAVTAVEAFDVTSAVGSGSDHSVWFSDGIPSGKDFDFQPAGKLVIFDDGSATLDGTIVAQSNGNASFVLDFEYDSNLASNVTAKLENGFSPADDINGWDFFNFTGGTLTGGGDLAGFNLDVSQRPVDGKHPLQVGIGANVKVLEMGASHWIAFKAASDCTSGFCAEFQNFRVGDVNVALTPSSSVQTVPVPLAAPMLAFAIAGLGFAARRRG